MDAPVGKPIPARVVPEKPTDIVGNFDKLRFHCTKPASDAELDHLEKLCGGGGLHVENGPARFDSRYLQRTEVRQPSDKAKTWLARRSDDIYINGAEFALDLCFDSQAGCDTAYAFVHRHLIRRWHGSKQEIRTYRKADERTRYDGPGTAPNRLVFYCEEYSRYSGALNCLHVEWRATTGAAMRSAGILSAADLLRFSHRDFWERHLLLRDVDPVRLGRLAHNYSDDDTSCKSPEDYREIGLAILSNYQTIQEFIDDNRAKFRIERALIHIPNDAWLPPEDDLPLSIVINDHESPTCSDPEPPSLAWIKFPRKNERCGDCAAAILKSKWDFRGKHIGPYYDPIEVRHFLEWVEGRNPRRGNFERDMSPAQIEFFENVLTDYRRAVNAARSAARAFIRQNRRNRRRRFR
jgi:hypothetical protein